MFYKGVWNGRDFNKNLFILETKSNVLKNFLLKIEREVQISWENLFFFGAPKKMNPGEIFWTSRPQKLVPREFSDVR